jgi:hypothetical protein
VQLAKLNESPSISRIFQPIGANLA